jgi:hypothetical protein
VLGAWLLQYAGEGFCLCGTWTEVTITTRDSSRQKCNEYHTLYAGQFTAGEAEETANELNAVHHLACCQQH